MEILICDEKQERAWDLFALRGDWVVFEIAHRNSGREMWDRWERDNPWIYETF